MLGRALARGREALENRLLWLAAHKQLTIVLVGAASLLGRAMLLPILPVPKPAIQDEFSYLLASDTFASGRLTNPTPPLAEHFETLQELVHPTYASKYPPLSGLAMALGQKLTGNPWVGVWLSNGILCATLCWSLQGWLPPVWALAGSLIALVRIGMVSYWTEGYWGGACAAIGGALVIGALPRLMRALEPGAALAFAGGVAMLANSRPYEGFILVAACSTVLFFAIARRLAPIWPISRGLILPMLALLIPVFVWMGYYNHRVTGDALEMPYLLHDNQYVVRSPLLWQTRTNPAPIYSNATTQKYWTVASASENQSARDHWLKAHFSDLLTNEGFYLGWPLALVMIAFAGSLWRDPVVRRALLVAACFYAGAAWDARLFPHYAAPATALIYILAASSLRAVRNGWPGAMSERRYISWGIVALFALTTVIAMLTPQNRYLFGPIDYHVRAKHASITRKLEQVPGRHLVLVQYGPRHDLYEELVFNQADLERSRVVWAHSLGPEKDSRLIDYFSDRQVWLVEEDGEVKLSPYEPLPRQLESRRR
jgi:hypothetical protein